MGGDIGNAQAWASPPGCWSPQAQHSHSMHPEDRPCPSSPPSARTPRPRSPPLLRAAHPGARRRDGHRDPAGPARRGRLPRRAVRRLADRRAGQQRPAQHHRTRDHLRHPPRVPRGRRRPDRDQHLQRHGDLAGRLRHAGARLRAQRRLGPARPRGVRRDDARAPRTSRATSSARSARPAGRRPSRPTSTTPAPATSPSTSWSRPTWSRPTGWSTAAPTCCSSRRSSTR